MSLTNMTPETEGLEHTAFYDRMGTAKQVEQPTFYTVTKRLMDILLSLTGLMILSPLFILLGVIIKIEDPKGPVFFKQKRVGKNGQVFMMIKFRSMVSNAEALLNDLLSKNEISGNMFKMKQDPRITRIGKIIRKTSIDELPQLINVLRGEMSLVGPRPALPREVNLYTSYDRQRLMVTPGCTGLWQVSGRNQLSFEEMVELDLKYIRTRSIVRDLKIILRTFKVFLGSSDAF
ncbi:sugar transferase [Paenibacillus glycinis]|uniref:Sugar transferase n=1 Tax=Paenibacillus glycinis TaxID=2697035 RepID=A0ABW9XLU9_9BACL|nr:sugar transferase [Paenibacillus glycinis]NBD23605.1 sugar transferase [Paenibacillus glycinis]